MAAIFRETQVLYTSLFAFDEFICIITPNYHDFFLQQKVYKEEGLFMGFEFDS